MKKFIKAISLATAQIIFKYGLAIVLIWIGFMKFKNNEALQLEKAIADTFLFSWMLKSISIFTFSKIIAWIHIVSGVLLVIKPTAKWGAILAIIIFFSSILVFVSSGIIWQFGYGFPELSRIGHSLLKDFVLFGVSLWVLQDSL